MDKSYIFTLHVQRGKADMTPSAARKFRRFATGEAERLLDMLNDWMATQETFRREGSSENRQVRLGLGVYLFEDDSNGSNPSKPTDHLDM